MIKKINDIQQSMLNPHKKILIAIMLMMMFTVKGLSQIQGGVYNEQKTGISNALIIAKDTAGNIIDSVRSDKRGFYTFKILKKGKYHIEATATGFTLKVYKNIEVINEEPAEEATGRNDVLGATRLEIFLTQVNKPKQ